MKILFFIGSLAAGGAERVTAGLANSLAERGNEVIVVTLCPAEDDFYVLDRRVIRAVLPNGDMASSTLWNALANNIRRVTALRRQLQIHKPDVAVGMMTTAAVVLAMAAIGLHRLKTIGSERIHPPQMPPRKFWAALRKVMYGRLTAVVALTSESKEWLTNHTSARNVVVIPNSVQWPLPTAAPILPVARKGEGRFLLLAVGRLAHQKGFDYLLSAFAALAPQHPDWSLAILGEGPKRAELENQLAMLGLSDRVMMPGKVGNLSDWYHAADAYVLSSRFEGFPNTLLEAMAHGVPSLSFDCDTGPRDLITDGVDGLLVRPISTETLVQGLARLFEDTKLRSDLGAEAKRVRERFSHPNILAMWDSLFLAAE